MAFELLNKEFNALAKACQTRFQVQGPLTISAMIKLIGATTYNTNLIVGSDNWQGYPGNDWAAFNVPNHQSDHWNGLSVALLNVNGLIGKKLTFEPGTYTFSVFAKLSAPDAGATGNIGFVGDVRSEDSIPEASLTTEWKKYIPTQQPSIKQ